jgi:eukaryotic-like serine/threonine-protein kinase
MLEAGEAVGVYRVLDRVGAGATAEVYRIQHQRLQSEYALKVIHPRGPSDVRRLENEGVVQSKLHHPNIVQVMDVLEVGGSLGLVMEFVEGPDLASWLEGRRLSIQEAIVLFDGIVRGVQHAHDAGLVHRDLKPANVLLQRVREGIIPKVSDFGIAKIFGDGASPGQTMQGTAMGTPRYMAPEQFTDAASVDQRADMFSLGCILYELVTGESAFSPSNLFEAHDSARQAAYRELPPDLPDEVKRAIRGCLEPDREKRIADCQTLLSVLGRPTHAKATATPVPIETIPPAESRPISEKTVAVTIAPLQDSGDTTDEMLPAATLRAAEERPASRKRLGVALIAIGILAGVVGYATRPPPAETPPPPASSAETVAPIAAPPVVPASVAEPVPEDTPPAPVPETAPAKRVVVRKAPVVVAPPPVETDPVAMVASALFVVEAAEDLLVTCGARSNSGTTSAKPTKFPAGPCTVAARVNGRTLTTIVEVREKARFVCAPKDGALHCQPG